MAETHFDYRVASIKYSVQCTITRVTTAWFALFLYLAGLLLAFGWRTLTQWRRTGDTGLRLDAGPAGTRRWWAKLLFVASLVLVLAGPVAVLLGLPLISVLDQPWLRVTGLVLALAGIGATFAAQLAMGASWRIGVDPAERTELVTGGAFTVVRNPIFTALAVTALGLALAVPSVVSVAAWLVLVAAVQLQVRVVEEPYLLTAHPRTYREYASATGRFLPGLGRLPSTDG
jgi:protein-S-isoprenylcysteine O-methyltransferase Ste14